MAALNTRDAEKRATAMEVFIAWYPASVLRTDAYEQAMAAWHAANQPAKADVIAGKNDTAKQSRKARGRLKGGSLKRTIQQPSRMAA